MPIGIHCVYGERQLIDNKLSVCLHFSVSENKIIQPYAKKFRRLLVINEKREINYTQLCIFSSKITLCDSKILKLKLL